MAKVLYSWWSKYMFWAESHGWPFGTPDPPTPIDSRTKLFLGHRGSSQHYPENTMLAFEKAVEEGAHGIETDIRKTADGVYVLMHDSTVDRTTNGTGSVSSLTWEQISQLDAGAWKGSQFANREDCRVPRLDDFLDHFRGKPIFLCLHIYVANMIDVAAIIEMIRERKMQEQCFVFTSRNILGQVKQYAPEMFVMNDGTNHEPWGLLAQAQAEGWNAISPGLANVSSDLIQAANASGIYVMASFISSNFETATQQLIDMGCNFILGDDCAAMVAVGDANNIEQITPPI